MQLEIKKLEIDVNSLRNSVEKKAKEMQSTLAELRKTDADQERCQTLEVNDFYQSINQSINQSFLEGN